MSDANNVSSLTQWVPVIGTLAGVFLGFIASFLIAIYNKSTERRDSKEERERKRLERIYELVIEINTERGTEMGNAINWIHYSTPIKENESKDISPIIELEMITKLYFPSLDSNRKEFINKVQKFGTKYFETRFAKWQNETKEKKQEVSGVLVSLNKEINDESEKMKIALVKLIKA